MKKSILLTHNNLKIDCLIILEKTLSSGVKEALVYAQSRLAKGLINEEKNYIEETSIVVDFCIIPELEEELYEIQSDC